MPRNENELSDDSREVSVRSVTPELAELRISGHAPVVQITAADRLSVAIEERVAGQDIALPNIQSTTALYPPELRLVAPEFVIQAALVQPGAQVPDGRLVAGVAVAWFEIVRHLRRDPAFLYQIGWRQFEELIAGAYEREGWSEVILTPRSGDGGRDVIATKTGLGSIRILDQAKKYGPHHLVAADEVRSMLGVLTADHNVSKGLITTTSDFAPGVSTDQRLQAFMPYRLELKNGPQLIEWLTSLLNTA